MCVDDFICVLTWKTWYAVSNTDETLLLNVLYMAGLQSGHMNGWWRSGYNARSPTEPTQPKTATVRYM